MRSDAFLGTRPPAQADRATRPTLPGRRTGIPPPATTARDDESVTLDTLICWWSNTGALVAIRMDNLHSSWWAARWWAGSAGNHQRAGSEGPREGSPRHCLLQRAL